jgi:hypothetical protein
MHSAIALLIFAASTAGCSICATLLIIDAPVYAHTAGGSAIIWLVGLVSTTNVLSAHLNP